MIQLDGWRCHHPGGLLIAVSGGPDSVALLRALEAVEPKDLHVAHLNHQLRAEAEADEAFVRELAATFRLPFVSHTIPIRTLGGNLEATARRERYAWLTHVAQERGLCMVATGHTASDQAETVLHRLFRGTGLEGLRGIASRRTLTDGIHLVRPILSYSRSEVLAYLESLGQPWRHDETNDDTGLTRNRLRHELLPLLARDYNPRVERVLAEFANQAEEMFSEDEAKAREWLSRSEVLGEQGVALLVVPLTIPGRILRQAIRLVWRREGWPMGEMNAEHWRGIEAVCQGKVGGRDLPGGVRARRERHLVRLVRS